MLQAHRSAGVSCKQSPYAKNKAVQLACRQVLVHRRSNARDKMVASTVAASTIRAAVSATAEAAVLDAAADAITRTAAPLAADSADSLDQKFNWQQCWYPVAALSALQTDAPNALQLLGMRLAVWKDKDGSWRAFEDLCPHRLAPLSEGRIHESGQLQCTYHGWLFDGSGSCTSIPQIPDPKAHATACSSNRACVSAYPTQVLHDMLWVYADSSSDTWAAAAAGQLGLPSCAVPELVADGWKLTTPWFQRDVPLSFDVVMENLTDPAHVAHSHHGVIGDRGIDHRMTVTPLGPLTTQGFKTLVQPMAGMTPYELSYVAPSLTRWHFPGATLTLYITPTAKGWSRMIMTFIAPADSKLKRPDNPNLPPLAVWLVDNVFDKYISLQHAINRNAIIDGDTIFMHFAERTLYARGNHASWSKQYYMPATADTAVLAWRKWLDRFGDQLPVLPKTAADLPPLLPREQVFDRYNQHTKHCPHCRVALRNTEIAIGVLAVVAALAAGSFTVAAFNAATAMAAGAAAAAGNGVGTAVAAKLAAGAAAVAGVAAALIVGLLKFRQLFIFIDYVHADH